MTQRAPPAPSTLAAIRRPSPRNIDRSRSTVSASRISRASWMRPTSAAVGLMFSPRNIYRLSLGRNLAPPARRRIHRRAGIGRLPTARRCALMGHGAPLHHYSTHRCLVQYRAPRGRFLATRGRNDPFRCRWKARTCGSLSDFWIGDFHRIRSKVEVASHNFDDVLCRHP